jgi:hypothetical protein
MLHQWLSLQHIKFENRSAQEICWRCISAAH